MHWGLVTSVRKSLELSSGEDKFIALGFDLGPYVFRGRLIDSQGQPNDRGSLVLTPGFPSPHLDFGAYIYKDHGGQFYFPALQTGTYQAAVFEGNPPKLKVHPLPPIEITGDMERDIVFDLPE